MNESAVADTGPFLHLSEIGQESQLTVFKLVTVSEQVEAELSHYGIFDHLSAILRGRFMVEGVTQSELDVQQAALSELSIHQTDLSVVALAARLVPEVVLTDDLELRKCLEIQGHSVVGSVGVLIRAFKNGRCTKTELRSYLDQLLNGSTLYLSKGFRIYIHGLLDGLTEEDADSV